MDPSPFRRVAATARVAECGEIGFAETLHRPGDGREADARLLLRTTADGVRGTLELGELPVPMDPSVAIEDGWCREREMVLVLGIGPTPGFVPLLLARTADGWAGSVELQGGHSLSLRVGAR